MAKGATLAQLERTDGFNLHIILYKGRYSTFSLTPHENGYLRRPKIFVKIRQEWGSSPQIH